MQSTTILLLLGLLALAAFFLGRGRSLVLVGGPGKGRALHSLPGYYGYYVAIWCVLPALFLLLAWVLLEPKVITALVVKGLPQSYQTLSSGELDLVVNNMRNLASGDVVSIAIDDNLRESAAEFVSYREHSHQLPPTLERYGLKKKQPALPRGNRRR